MSIFNKLDAVVNRFNVLTEKMGDPTLYERQEEYQAITKERSNLEDVVAAYKEYSKIKANLEEAKDILKNEKDEDMREMAKEELSEYESQLPGLEDELKLLLLPKDPLDDKDVMVEIRAGAGGDEASIFVADVYRMYQNYCRSLGFKTENVSVSESLF
jgi:peptide chain release factor 1